MTNKISEPDIETALLEVIDKDDPVIVIYSAIWSFAHRLGGDVKEATSRIFDVINSVVGEDRTILFPTFTNQFVKTKRFDIALDDSDCSGVLANYAFRSPGFKRTRQPIHSYVVKGPLSEEVLNRPCSTAWGDDSVIGWMGEVNARFCPIGLPWHYACSFYHRIEELNQVPYRYYKRFPGLLLDNGHEIGTCAEVKYSYSLNVTPEFDHTIVEPCLEKIGAIRKSSNPLVPIQSAKGHDILKVTSELLSRDEYAYVKNREEVKAWVMDGKEQEVSSLKQEERWP